MTNDEMRALFFASSNRRFKDVRVTWNACELAVRIVQPSVAERAAIIDSAKLLSTNKGGTVADMEAFEKGRWLAILKCAHNPDSGEPLFAYADKENVLKNTALFDQLSVHCLAALEMTSEERGEEIEKN